MSRRPGSEVVAAGATLLAGAAVVGALGYLLVLCAGPIATPDLWFHLEMGEVYARHGPWLAGDPLLHTAYPHAPVPHEWLFGVAVHGLDRAVGLGGLRAVHGLAAAAILGLAYSLFRRQSRCAAAACCALACFAVLAAPRLLQLRPDLVSIPAAFLVYRLVLEGEEPPSRSRVAACVALLWLWANAHSLFSIGLALLLAGLAGVLLRLAVRRRGRREADGPEPRTARERLRARRIAAALGLGFLSTLANPRGLAQHLAFLDASRDTAIWSVVDEWNPFRPFALPESPFGPDRVAWLLTDALLAAFGVSAALALIALWRRPSERTLDRADPVRAALGVASALALLVSVRFLWMAAFPLLFLLRRERSSLAPGSARAAHLTCAWSAAAVAVALALLGSEPVATSRDLLPRSFAEYLSRPYARRFFAEGVSFLRETGVEGNLFNTYPMGGFIAYWLAPRVRTFIDGRTEHYPPEVFRDYMSVLAMRGAQPGESFLDVLERRRVDLFFGVGTPPGDVGSRYTAAHLERAPGWLLVSRARRHAIYLRSDARNRANLRRIEAYYEREGVPFDARRGFEVGAVVRERPEWAVAHGILPLDYASLLAARAGSEPGARAAALEQLGLAYALAGAYELQLAVDREAIALDPRSQSPRRRLAYGLLRLGRDGEAIEATRQLAALDPANPALQEHLEAVRRVAQGRREPQPAHPERPSPEELVGRLWIYPSGAR